MNIFGVEIDELKIIPMDQFNLNWRFTDPKYNQLPISDLEKIQPLESTISEKFCEILSEFVSDSSFLEYDDSCRTDLDIVDTNLVKKWLIEKVGKSDQKVFLFWYFGNDAVATSWDIFVRYWDDFCYPSSDDVFIFPAKADWMIFYSHEEIFQFKYTEIA